MRIDNEHAAFIAADLLPMPRHAFELELAEHFGLDSGEAAALVDRLIENECVAQRNNVVELL